MRKNKKNKVNLIIHSFLGLLLILSSCSPEYIPNMVNTPMFTNQGEVQFNVASGSSNFDVQTAVAITDNIGMMINGSYENETRDSTGDYHRHVFIEGGLGYYNKFGEIGRYEIYGGYGFGEVEGHFENALFQEDRITDARYKRFFIQPAIGISTGIYDGSFATRMVFVEMDPNGDGFNSGSYNTLIEPVFTSKIGYKWVKFIFQIGACLPFDEKEFNFDHETLILNAGIHINIGRRYYTY